MFIPLKIAVASMAAAGLIHHPGALDKPFAEVKANVLGHLSHAIEQLDTRAERIAANDAMNSDAQAKRLAEIAKREAKLVEIKASVEAATNFDELKATRPEPKHDKREAHREIRNDRRELREDRKEARRDEHELRRDIREHRIEQHHRNQQHQK